MSNQTTHDEYRRVADVLERDRYAVQAYVRIAESIERGLRHVAATQAITEARGSLARTISHLQSVEEQLTEDVEYNRERAKRS